MREMGNGLGKLLPPEAVVIPSEVEGSALRCRCCAERTAGTRISPDAPEESGWLRVGEEGSGLSGKSGCLIRGPAVEEAIGTAEGCRSLGSLRSLGMTRGSLRSLGMTRGSLRSLGMTNGFRISVIPSFPLHVHVPIHDLHVAERGGGGGEAVAFVEWGRVAREEGEAAQPLKLRMQEDALDEPVAESAAAILLEDEDVGEIGIRGEVGDDARKADLALALEETEGDRAGDRAFDDVTRNAGRPVGGRQDAVYEIDVESRSVGRDYGVVAPALVGKVVHGRAGAVMGSVGRREGDVGVDRFAVTPDASARSGGRDGLEADLEQLRLRGEGGRKSSSTAVYAASWSRADTSPT